MNSKKFNKERTKKLAYLALLTALVALLSYLGGFIKIGGFASISLTLIPVVLGAVLLGPAAGAWLGGVSGIVFFITPDAGWWFTVNAFGTVTTVMIKGVLAGLCAGIVYNALRRYNQYLAVLASAVICPIVNTGIFILGCLIFFKDSIVTGAATEQMSVFMYILLFYVGLNFVFELIANVVLSPVIVRVLNIVKVKTAALKDKTKID